MTDKLIDRFLIVCVCCYCTVLYCVIFDYVSLGFLLSYLFGSTCTCHLILTSIYKLSLFIDYD